jgi:hypothetical protein
LEKVPLNNPENLIAETQKAFRYFLFTITGFQRDLTSCRSSLPAGDQKETASPLLYLPCPTMNEKRRASEGLFSRNTYSSLWPKVAIRLSNSVFAACSKAS